MQPEQYQRIHELFLTAATIQPGDRADFLDRNCDDEAVRAGVDRLLAALQPIEVAEPKDTSNTDTPPEASIADVTAASFADQQLPQTTIHLRSPDGSSWQEVLETSSTELPFQDSIERYSIEGEIARGGMGAVLKCRDEKLGRNLAIKVLLQTHKHDSEIIQRFIEEAQIGGQLQHPGIAPVYELGQFSDGRPFISMKLVKGKTLKTLLRERQDPESDLGRFLGIFEQVCQAMAYVHTRGVIHRDLKSSNIMVGAFGETQVMDWGLAKVIPQDGIGRREPKNPHVPDASIIRTARSNSSDTSTGTGSTVGTGSHTRLGTVLGTPAYMPPEQAMGDIDQLDERVDVFALGAILCEILTGKPPYSERDTDIALRKAVQGRTGDCLARLEQCDADQELVTLARDCIEIDPDDRPQNAGQVADRISSYLASVQNKLHQAEIDSAAQSTRLVEEQKRRKLSYVMAGLIVVFAISGLIVWQQVSKSRAELQAKANQRERASRADAMVNLLLSADMAQLPEILETIDPLKSLIMPELENRFTESNKESDERIRFAIALQESDPGQSQFLFAQFPQMDLEQFEVVQKTLASVQFQPNREALESLWQVALDDNQSQPKQFHSACALALYDNDDQRWNRLGPRVARLVTRSETAVPSTDLEQRANQLRSVRPFVTQEMTKTLADANGSNFSKQRAAICLSILDADRIDKIVDYVLLCREYQRFAWFLPLLRENLSSAIEHLDQRIESVAQLPTAQQGTQKHPLSIAAVIKGNLGQSDDLITLLKDPAKTSLQLELQSLAKHYVREIPVDSQTLLIELSDNSTAAFTKFQLIQLLGQRGIESISEAEQNAITDRLTKLAKETVDSGVRQSCLQALRRFKKDYGLETISVSSLDATAHQIIVELDAEIDHLRTERAKAIKDLPARRKRWETELAAQPAGKFELDPSDLVLKISTEKGSRFELTTQSKNREFIEKQIEGARKVGGMRGNAIEFLGQPPINLSDAASFKKDQPHSFGAWVYVDPNKQSQWSAVFSRMDSQNGNRGVDLWIDGGRIGTHISHREPDNYIKVVTQDEMNRQFWHHMFVTYDGSGKASGVNIYFDGRPQSTTVVSDSLDGPIDTKKPMLLGSRSEEQMPFSGWVEDIQVYDRELSDSEVELIYLSAINLILNMPQPLKPERQGPLERAFRDEGIKKFDSELDRLRKERNDRIWSGRRRWYVNQQDQSFALFSSADSKPQEQTEYEFAVSTHEVTVEQFRRFDANFNFNKDAGPSSDCPINSVTWFDVAAYCNWLNKRENIPEDQWCFLPNDEGRYDLGMKIQPDITKLTGYRIPTPDEWQYVCRSDSPSRYYFGSSDQLMVEHGWYNLNSAGRTHPVGSLAPNRFGLFDMYGNVWEWTLKVDYLKKPGIMDNNASVFLKGGGADSDLSSMTTDVYSRSSPAQTNAFRGFRLARTIDLTNPWTATAKDD